MKLRHRTPVLIVTTAAAGGIAVALGVAASQAASASSSGASNAGLSLATAATASAAPSVPGAPDNDGDGHGGAPGFGGPGGFGHGPGGPGGPGDFHGQLLHGEQVVQQGTVVKTIDEQGGTVTAVSATSLTVRSTDGFTATYVVTSGTIVDKDGVRSTIASVKSGDTVRVEGEKKGSTVTATHVGDGKPPQHAWTPPTGPRPSGPASPKPSPTQSS